MILAAWLSILGALLLTSFCHAMAPPVAVALEAARNDPEVAVAASSPHDDALAVPEKRLLKYFLPAAQGWGSNDVPYVAQEGAKRGYSDRNFLRFGRGVDKRAKNFLRFGRGQSEDYDEEDMEGILTIPAEKRNKNFLRFGRDRNFLRFGRAGGEQVSHDAGPLEFAHDLKVEEPSEEAQAELDPYLRDARGNNFLRFGRNYNKNFLRFGRSVDSQTYCEDCDDEENLIEQSSAPSSSSSSSSTVTKSQDEESNNKKSEASDASSSSVVSKSSTEGDARSKRAVSVYHDYAKVPSRGPASWARAFPKPDEDDDDDDDEGYASRSPYNKDSWHFGNDHLYRFGKKRPTSGSSSSKDSSTESPAQSAKKTKTHNAIRFG